MTPRTLSQVELLLLTLAGAVVTANAYYIHPIIARVAEDFGVSAATIGLVPALNQIALALGIFLLLPLGDRVNNRRLVSIFVIAQFLALVVMALSGEFVMFLIGSTVLGFVTIAPYLLPAYVSKRVDPTHLGHVTATLTTGVILGILLARAGAGMIGEYLGWRTVYYIAAGLMLVIALVIPLIMDREEPEQSAQDQLGYFKLLASMAPIVGTYPTILLSGAIQALNFGIFLTVWLGLGLHLTSPEMGYGVDVVGYLAIFSIINLATTPRMGRLADSLGPSRARFYLTLVQLFGVCLFFFFGHSLWLLMIPIVITNLVGPVIDVSGRMTFLSQAPAIRTRLMTIYIVLMFLGGGLCSWAGTAAYEWGGWTATAVLSIALSTLVVALSFISFRSSQTAAVR
jgi:predicted MFS family arabinose efflux permease